MGRTSKKPLPSKTSPSPKSNIRKSERLRRNASSSASNSSSSQSQSQPSPTKPMRQQKITELSQDRKPRQDTKKLSKIQPPETPSRTSKPKPSTSAAAKNLPKKLNKESFLLELKQFDLNSVYGPCSGISRIERLDRALEYKLGKDLEMLKQLKQNLMSLMTTDEIMEKW